MKSEPAPARHEDAVNMRDLQRVVVSYDEDLKTPILDAAQRLLQFWKTIAVLTIVGGISGVALSFILPKEYRVEAQYSFTADENNSNALGGLRSRFGGLASLAGVDLGSSAASHAEVVAALKSEAFIRAFVHDEALLSVLFADDWNEGTRSWKSEDDEHSVAEGYLKLTRDVLSVSEDKTTSLLRVSAQWSDPDIAKRWIEVLVARLNESLRLQAMERADRNLEFLQHEIQQTQTLELSQALYGLIESETRQKMTAKVNLSYALRAVDPPVAPDLTNFASPNRPLTAILGAMLGAFLGIAYAGTCTLIRKRM